MQLRPYQAEDVQKIYAAWLNYRHLLYVLPTGGGKTVIFAHILRNHHGASCVIAHRQELVTQISTALNNEKIPHKIIAPPHVIKAAVKIHMESVGYSYYKADAQCAIAGIDSLVRKVGDKDTEEWAESVSLVVQDEAAHLLRDNKWGKGFRMFPNAKLLGVTATPCRADRKGLGSHADGFFDHMILGPTYDQLTSMGYLSTYRIFAPPSDINVENIKISADGDFNKVQLKTEVRRSRIIGDVVEHYKRLAMGKLGVTFVPDVETAKDIAAEYCANGVPAEVVTAKTPSYQRFTILEKFKRREILQLVNVDIFGEGFDLPAIEVVSFARPTMSLSLYMQQFGRALRILKGKLNAIIIDHVGNVMRHGLPDTPRTWTLDRQKKSQTPDDVPPTRNCLNPPCMAVYKRYLKACPYCGTIPIPAARSSPKFVDGELAELDEQTLLALRWGVTKIDLNQEEYAAYLDSINCPEIGFTTNMKRHEVDQMAQKELRDSMAQWAGWRTAEGRTIGESQKMFYFKFGIDVLSAQALKANDAATLKTRVEAA